MILSKDFEKHVSACEYRTNFDIIQNTISKIFDEDSQLNSLKKVKNEQILQKLNNQKLQDLLKSKKYLKSEHRHVQFYRRCRLLRKRRDNGQPFLSDYQSEHSDNEVRIVGVPGKRKKWRKSKGRLKRSKRKWKGVKTKGFLSIKEELSFYNVKKEDCVNNRKEEYKEKSYSSQNQTNCYHGRINKSKASAKIRNKEQISYNDHNCKVLKLKQPKTGSSFLSNLLTNNDIKKEDINKTTDSIQNTLNQRCRRESSLITLSFDKEKDCIQILDNSLDPIKIENTQCKVEEACDLFRRKRESLDFVKIL